VAKVVRKEKREWRERVMTVSEWTKRTQREVNIYVRERDKFDGCISCHMPATYEGRWHASHYRSTGAAPELRFNLLNIHKSCAQCNEMKSGNVVEYRIRLVQKIGPEAVEWLEGPHEPKRYRIDELKAICHEYRVKTKVLRAQRENAAAFA
jgi:hypothetical protein